MKARTLLLIPLIGLFVSIFTLGKIESWSFFTIFSGSAHIGQFLLPALLFAASIIWMVFLDQQEQRIYSQTKKQKEQQQKNEVSATEQKSTSKKGTLVVAKNTVAAPMQTKTSQEEQKIIQDKLTKLHTKQAHNTNILAIIMTLVLYAHLLLTSFNQGYTFSLSKILILALAGALYLLSLHTKKMYEQSSVLVRKKTWEELTPLLEKSAIAILLLLLLQQYAYEALLIFFTLMLLAVTAVVLQIYIRDTKKSRT